MFHGADECYCIVTNYGLVIYGFVWNEAWGFFYISSWLNRIICISYALKIVKLKSFHCEGATNEQPTKQY